jgi:hypothetical protein
LTEHRTKRRCLPRHLRISDELHSESTNGIFGVFLCADREPCLSTPVAIFGFQPRELVLPKKGAPARMEVNILARLQQSMKMIMEIHPERCKGSSQTGSER